MDGAIRTDADRLDEQYRTSENLRARIGIHRFGTAKENWYHWVLGRLDLPANARVLELGAGRGDLWSENAGRVPPGWRIMLTDLSPGMLEAARDAGVEAELGVVDAHELPFDDESFDAVVANHMLYHLADLPKALGEIRRVLVAGGRLVATTVGPGHLHELRDLARRHAPRHEWSEFHVRFGLETGAERLRGFFAEVELHRYEDALEVTDADAVVAYIASMPAGGTADANAIRREVAASIERAGSFAIRKDTGLFRARKH